MMPYQRLHAWKTCHHLALTTYRATQAFPKCELYGLTSQMRRAAFSAPANIAEGSAKRGPKEFRRFLDTALGSLAELSYAILFARELGYLSEPDWKELDDLRNVAGKLTWGLYRLISERGA
jgi:four helix bundle protein